MSSTQPTGNPRAARRMLSRRDFLGYVAGSVALTCTGCLRVSDEPCIGLALGGGGAKGLAHILMLETLDEMGIRPRAIAGTSIGAIIGALYAAGLTGADIRALIEQFLVDEQAAEDKLIALPKSFRWLDFIDPAFGGGGLLDSSDFISFVGEHIPAQRFRNLKIPLKVATAELRSGKQVVIETGELLPALQASMAVPGVFPPVILHGRELVDGGVANPLPYDLLADSCDVVVAIDVSGNRDSIAGEELSSMGVLLQSFQAMSHNILAGKLGQQRPEIYIKPDIRNVRMLEFYKAKLVFQQAQPAREQLRRQLQRAQRRYRGQSGCSTG